MNPEAFFTAAGRNESEGERALLPQSVWWAVHDGDQTSAESMVCSSPDQTKRFCKSLGRLRSRETISSGEGMLLTSTLDIARRWKEYTEDLLNPTVTPSIMEADPGDEGDPCLSLGVRSLMQLNKCRRRGVCSNCRGITIISKNFCAREESWTSDSEGKMWFCLSE